MNATYWELAKELQEKLAERDQPYWVAIAGPPGAGKSTLSLFLCDRLGEEAVAISMDGYHFYRHELDAMADANRAHQRRGAPFTFNAQKFVTDLVAAHAAGTAWFPSFDHHIGDPVERDVEFDATRHRLVIVEGNYLLLPDEPWFQLRPLFDEAWFLDVPLNVIRLRLIDRFLSMGLTKMQARERVEANDLKNAERVIEDSRERASRLISQ